jgi:hypothetical protein
MQYSMLHMLKYHKNCCKVSMYKILNYLYIYIYIDIIKYSNKSIIKNLILENINI